MGLCWDTGERYGIKECGATSSELSEARKVEIVWNPTYKGFTFKLANETSYLKYEATFSQYWYNGESELFSDHTYTFNVYMATRGILADTIMLNNTSVNLTLGDKLQLNASLLPDNASQRNITWISTNEAVAHVSSNGLVTTINWGTANIIAFTTDGSNLSATCTINVASTGKTEWTEVTDSNLENLTAESVIIIRPYGYNNTSNMPLSSNETDAVLISTQEAGASGNLWTLKDAGNGYYYLVNSLGLYWSYQQNNNPSVAMKLTSSKDNAVRVKPIWNTTYSAVTFMCEKENAVLRKLDKDRLYGRYNWYGTGYNEDHYCSFHVHLQSELKSLSFDATRIVLKKDASAVINLTYSPAKANINTIAMKSSDESVVSVSTQSGSDGIIVATVTGHKAGTASIIAESTDGSGLTVSCDVTVTETSAGWTYTKEKKVSSIAELMVGSVIKIYPYDMDGVGNMALSSNTTNAVLTSTGQAGEAGNLWTLEDAGDGDFYLVNSLGQYWAFQQSGNSSVAMKVASSRSYAVRVRLVWNATYPGVAFLNVEDRTYLNNLFGYNYRYNWYSGSTALTYDSNSTYIVYAVSRDDTESGDTGGSETGGGDTGGGDTGYSELVWTEVKSSNFRSLKAGSVIKIFPYGQGNVETLALSSNTTDCTLTSTERAGDNSGNEWTLIEAGDGYYYLKNNVGLYWAYQQSNISWRPMTTVNEISNAVKVSLVWNDAYTGIAFCNTNDGCYLNNLFGYNYRYNWYGDSSALTYDSNSTYAVYVGSSNDTEGGDTGGSETGGGDTGGGDTGGGDTGGGDTGQSELVWTEVTSSNFRILKAGSVIKIYPYGHSATADMALSSSTTGEHPYTLASTQRVGDAEGNVWTLVDAGNDCFYLKNAYGLYWAYQQSDSNADGLSTVTEQSDAVGVVLVWNNSHSGVSFKNSEDNAFLNNLWGGCYIYNWWAGGGDAQTAVNNNSTYNVFVGSTVSSDIEPATADSDTPGVYYRLDGLRLAGKPQHEGLFILVKDGKSRKVFIRKP